MTTGSPMPGPLCPERPLVGTDSQVVAACIAKGRSSSPRLNHILRTFLPNVVSRGLFTLPFWIGTKFDVADDPTRDVPLRAPLTPWPDWAASVEKGDFRLLDDRAEALTYDAPAPALF